MNPEESRENPGDKSQLGIPRLRPAGGWLPPELAISNVELSPDKIPQRSDEWLPLSRFAISYDGYERFFRPDDRGYAMKKCSDIAGTIRSAFLRDGSLPGSLDDLRTALFFEQRRSRRNVYNPDYQREHVDYMWKLVEAIRRIVRDQRASRDIANAITLASNPPTPNDS